MLKTYKTVNSAKLKLGTVPINWLLCTPLNYKWLVICPSLTIYTYISLKEGKLVKFGIVPVKSLFPIKLFKN